MSDVRLESPLPASLPPGRATALFLAGSHAPDAGRFRIEVDGLPHRPAATNRPRSDLPDGRRGWWATVPVRATDLPVRLSAGGSELATVPREAPPTAPPRGAAIAVCLATYDPDPDLLRVQLESLRGQTERDWVCLVSDDASPDPAVLRDAIGGDERFVVSRSETRRGFYRNFERALGMVPPDAQLIALCDQDDRWHPDKLAVLRDALDGARLVFSDQRLTAPDGRVLRDTLWAGRAVNHTDLRSMLVANSVTGAACLFGRDLLDVLLPFPDTPGLQFHDHWLGVAALAAGDVAYVDRPLYDYVQHGGAVFGDVTTRAHRRTRRSGRAAYFLGYLAREVQAQTLLARIDGALDPAKRAVLDEYVAAERSPKALLRLLTRADRTSTLGTERELAAGVLWRWLPRRDAAFPDPLAFEQRRLRAWRSRL
jgi:glycosyltransferase involved in cell wall biosynthesis